MSEQQFITDLVNQLESNSKQAIDNHELEIFKGLSGCEREFDKAISEGRVDDALVMVEGTRWFVDLLEKVLGRLPPWTKLDHKLRCQSIITRGRELLHYMDDHFEIKEPE